MLNTGCPTNDAILLGFFAKHLNLKKNLILHMHSGLVVANQNKEKHKINTDRV